MKYMNPSYPMASVSLSQLTNGWVAWNCPLIYLDSQGNKLIIILSCKDFGTGFNTDTQAAVLQ